MRQLGPAYVSRLVGLWLATLTGSAAAAVGVYREDARASLPGTLASAQAIVQTSVQVDADEFLVTRAWRGPFKPGDQLTFTSLRRFQDAAASTSQEALRRLVTAGACTARPMAICSSFRRSASISCHG